MTSTSFHAYDHRKFIHAAQSPGMQGRGVGLKIHYGRRQGSTHATLKKEWRWAREEEFEVRDEK